MPVSVCTTFQVNCPHKGCRQAHAGACLSVPAMHALFPSCYQTLMYAMVGCVIRVGLMLAEDLRHCDNINECATGNGACEQVCADEDPRTTGQLRALPCPLFCLCECRCGMDYGGMSVDEVATWVYGRTARGVSLCGLPEIEHCSCCMLEVDSIAGLCIPWQRLTAAGQHASADTVVHIHPVVHAWACHHMNVSRRTQT